MTRSRISLLDPSINFGTSYLQLFADNVDTGPSLTRFSWIPNHCVTYFLSESVCTKISFWEKVVERPTSRPSLLAFFWSYTDELSGEWHGWKAGCGHPCCLHPAVNSTKQSHIRAAFSLFSLTLSWLLIPWQPWQQVTFYKYQTLTGQSG